MAVVLDAADHPAPDRGDLVHEVIASTGVRRRLRLAAPPEAVELTVEAWTLGSTRFLRTIGTSLTLSRTERDVRVDPAEMVAIALARTGCTYTACARRDPGRLDRP